MSHLYQISLACVIGHLMCHRRLPTTDFQWCREGGRGVKKCFLSLRQTALLSAEGKNKTKGKNKFLSLISGWKNSIYKGKTLFKKLFLVLKRTFYYECGGFGVLIKRTFLSTRNNWKKIHFFFKNEVFFLKLYFSWK
jgi:hypothetical protein